jgi:hypothetical protein
MREKTIMKFCVTWSISQDKWLSVLRTFTSMSPKERADAGEGVKIIGRWHNVAARTGVVIFEANDLMALQRYAGKWNPYMEVTIAPVVDDEESVAVNRQMLADHEA